MFYLTVRQLFLSMRGREREKRKIRGLCQKVAAQEEVQLDLVKQSLGWSGFDGFERMFEVVGRATTKTIMSAGVKKAKPWKCV